MKMNAFLTVAIVGLVGNVHAATVLILPNPTEVMIGDTFNMEIVGTDFDVVLDGGGLNVHYDPSVVQLYQASLDTSLWDPDFSAVSGGIDNDTGYVTGIYFNSSEDVTGDFPIATLEFSATALGNSPVELSQFDINPFASGGVITPVTFENGFINVSPVPLPAAAWFMLAGLGLLLARSGRHPTS